VSFAPDGTVPGRVAFSGATQAPGSTSAVLASRSTDGGLTWSAPAVLISDAGAFFNDKDSISADPTDARLVYAVWDRLTPNGGPSSFARSTDGGSSWELARTIYAPGTGNQTLNKKIFGPNDDGTLIDFFTLFVSVATQTDLVSLRLVRSADKGVTWSAPIMISSVQTVGTADPQTGAPVRDGSTLGSIAAGPHGELAVTWQDARFATGPHDGIAFSRSLDGGLTWSAPVGINAVPGVPAFEPSIAIRSDGTMGISYYDFRNNTASPATLSTDYWITRSGDGIVWRETHVSGSFDLDVAPVAEGLFLGDYQGLGAIGETFVPFFVQTNDGNFANPTDVFASLSVLAIPAAGAKAKAAAPLRRRDARPCPDRDAAGDDAGVRAADARERGARRAAAPAGRAGQGSAALDDSPEPHRFRREPRPRRPAHPRRDLGRRHWAAQEIALHRVAAE
jgi:hypothetical protein